MNIFDLSHIIETARAELNQAEDKHLAAIKATVAMRADRRARDKYSGFLDTKKATLHLMDAIQEYFDYAIGTKGIAFDESGRITYDYIENTDTTAELIIGESSLYIDLTRAILRELKLELRTWSPDTYRIVIYKQQPKPKE